MGGEAVEIWNEREKELLPVIVFQKRFRCFSLAVCAMSTFKVFTWLDTCKGGKHKIYVCFPDAIFPCFQSPRKKKFFLFILELLFRYGSSDFPGGFSVLFFVHSLTAPSVT